MEDAKYLDLIAKYLSGNLDGPDREVLFGWVAESDDNRKFFDEMIQLWSVSGAAEEKPYEADVAAAWEVVEKKLSPVAGNAGSPSAKIVRLSNWGRMLRYAAVILLLLAAGYWWFGDKLNGNSGVVETGRGERTEVTLPDGSIIWLNENTRLVYDPAFEQREVRMEGEAFFDVERLEDRPFTILSGDTRTVVLGTSFNVRAYPGEDRVEVTVRTGQVRLEEQTAAAPDAILLEAGESGVYDRKNEKLEEVDRQISNADSWKTRTLDFNEQNMAQVIPALERYFGLEVEVENEDLYRCPFYGTYPDPDFDSLVVWINEANLEGVLRIEKVQDGLYRMQGRGCPENE